MPFFGQGTPLAGQDTSLFGQDTPLAGQDNSLFGQDGLSGQGNPLAGQGNDLAGQDRELMELYDMLYQEENSSEQTSRRDLDLLFSALANIQNPSQSENQELGALKKIMEMRDASPTEKAMGGNVDSEVAGRMAKMMMGFEPRKSLTREQIHNYGVMYGEPLTQKQIDYFEDQLNRNPDDSYFGNFPEYPKG